MKTIFIRIDEEDHNKFKKLCLESSVIMTDVIRDFIKKLVVDLEEENEK